LISHLPVDKLSDGTSDSLNRVLHTIEGSFGEELKARTDKRSWTDAQKRQIIKDYKNKQSGRVAWLKNEYDLTPTYIYMWRKQLEISE